MKKKCHYCKRRNANPNMWMSMAPDDARFCSVECIEKYARKKIELEEKANEF